MINAESAMSKAALIKDAKIVQAYFFDTNALRALNHREELPILISACKEGKIKLYLSDTVLLEYAMHQYEFQVKNHKHPHEHFMKEEARSEFLRQIYYQYRVLFERSQVQIIELFPNHNEIAESFFHQAQTFNSQNKSDQKDVRIITAAITEFEPNEVIIVCHETKIINYLRSQGYQVIGQSKDLISQLKDSDQTCNMELPSYEEASRDAAFEFNRNNMETLKSLHPKLVSILAERGMLDKTLEEISSQDKETQVSIMAYTNALAPIAKDTLIELMQSKADLGIINSNISRLQSAGILFDTGNHWVPNSRKPGASIVCEQAMVQRIDDITQLLENI